jgi:hypothetical protein
VKASRVTTAVKSYAMTITVPEVELPGIETSVAGMVGEVSYPDPWDVIDLQRSSNLVNWQNQSVARIGEEETATYALPGERYFRLKMNCAGSGGVLIPWPDFGGIVVIPFPFPDPSDIIIGPGDILSDPRWKDILKDFVPPIRALP